MTIFPRLPLIVRNVSDILHAALGRSGSNQRQVVCPPCFLKPCLSQEVFANVKRMFEGAASIIQKLAEGNGIRLPYHAAISIC